MSHDMPQVTLERILAAVEDEESIREIWLFGSRARGDNKENSDIDLALVGSDISHQTITKITKAGGLRKLDIVCLNELEPDDLLVEINKDKVLLFARKPKLDPQRSQINGN